MDKSKRIAGILSKRVSTDISPHKTAENYYRSVRRPIYQKPQLQFPRTAQLEEKDKRKPVFTGESDLYFDVNLEKYREYGFDCALTPMPTIHSNLSLAIVGKYLLPNRQGDIDSREEGYQRNSNSRDTACWV